MGKVINFFYYGVAIAACISAWTCGALVSSGVTFAQQMGEMRGAASMIEAVAPTLEQLQKIRVKDL